MWTLVHRGPGPIAIGYLLSATEASKERLRAALPGFSIVITGGAPAAPTKADLAEAYKLAGASPTAQMILVGWSMGCKSVRALLADGVDPDAIVAVDGTHDTYPIPTHVELWRAYAERARRGERLFVASATQQVYVEHLSPPDGPFMATIHVLELIVGHELPAGTSTHESNLHVLSCTSAAIDAPAHLRQQTELLPDLLRVYVAPHFDAAPDTDRPPPVLDIDPNGSVDPDITPTAHEVQRVSTPCTDVELVDALRDGHRVAFGNHPAPERLGVGWAQLALESGRGQRQWCHNVGNITAGRSWHGNFYWLDVPPPDPPKLKFRAYDSHLVGAADYWTMLYDKFRSALVFFDAGDAAAAAHELGRLHYFLAPVESYSQGMASLYAEGVRRGLFAPTLPAA